MGHKHGGPAVQWLALQGGSWFDSVRPSAKTLSIANTYCMSMWVLQLDLFAEQCSHQVVTLVTE